MAKTIFFLALFVIGLVIFKDYGVHIDELHHQYFGDVNLEYIINVEHQGLANTVPMIDSFERQHVLSHGPCLEIPFAFFKKYLKLTDDREVLHMRRLVCFLLYFLGVIFFYLLCKSYFKSRNLAMLGCLFLVFSPRIFANAFYDSYDVPFLSFYVISIFTLLRWLRQKSFFNASVHALSCALLIDLRPIGLVLPLFTFLVYMLDVLKMPSNRIKINAAAQFLFYAVFSVVLVIAGWPLLWTHPLANFLAVLHENSQYHYPFDYTSLFEGRQLRDDSPPWYFGEVWILITTPVLYIFYFFIGSWVSLRSVFKSNIFVERRDNILFLLCFFFPLFLTTGKLYNSWRHIFFIYPAFVMIALIGVCAIWDWIKIHFNGKPRFFGQALMILATVLSLSCTFCFMVRNHPFEYVYFNSIAGKDMQEIKSRFDLDYWGLPYKQGLELILKNDPDRLIAVSSGVEFSRYISDNLLTLPVEDRMRFQVTTIGNAKYLMTNYQWHPEEYPYPIYDSFKVGNARILGIYKLK